MNKKRPQVLTDCCQYNAQPEPVALETSKSEGQFLGVRVCAKNGIPKNKVARVYSRCIYFLIHGEILVI